MVLYNFLNFNVDLKIIRKRMFGKIFNLTLHRIFSPPKNGVIIIKLVTNIFHRSCPNNSIISNNTYYFCIFFVLGFAPQGIGFRYFEHFLKF